MAERNQSEFVILDTAGFSPVARRTGDLVRELIAPLVRETNAHICMVDSASSLGTYPDAEFEVISAVEITNHRNRNFKCLQTLKGEVV